MLHIALFEPEIPPNTGNIARSCAATDTALHLIGKLGFKLDDKYLRRAGMDYWHSVDVRRHASYGEFEKTWTEAGGDPLRIFAFTTKGTTIYTQVNYRENDCLLFGGESNGLPAEMISRFGDRALTIPMPSGKVRSLNLSTATGIVLYEALRQLRRW